MLPVLWYSLLAAGVAVASVRVALGLYDPPRWIVVVVLVSLAAQMAASAAEAGWNRQDGDD